VHQDDEETPIESDNLEVLISMISDWMDWQESDVMDVLNDDGELVVDDQTYEIIKMKVKTCKINQDDKAEIKQLRNKYEESERAMQQRYPLDSDKRD